MMKEKFANLSLKVKVPLVFCLVLALSLGGMSGTLYPYYRNTFDQMISESLSAAISANANGIRSLIRSIGTAADVVNDNDSAYYYTLSNAPQMHMSTISALIVGFQGKQDKSDLRSMLDNMNLANIMFESIFNPVLGTEEERGSAALFVDSRFPISEYCTSWSNYGGARIFKSDHVEDKEWFQRAVAAGGDAYWFGDESVPQRLCMAKLMTYQSFSSYSDYRIEKLGVLMLSFDLASIEEKMDLRDLTQGTQMFISDGVGQVLYRGGGNALSDSDALTLLESAENAQSLYREYNGAQFLIQKDDLGQGLVMFTAIPVDDVWRAAEQMVSVIFIVMVGILVLAIALASLLSRRMVAPIVKLANQMKRGMVERVNDHALGDDEIGLLYRGYNELQDKIQDLIQQAWDSAEKQKKAELQLLQRQIHPHFVYNTLGTMSAYALLHGQDDMAQNLSRLSEIMRYCTQNPDGLVTLGEEMNFIAQYEALQQKSFDDSVVFHHDVAPECLDILIPKLLIQPLVENAIVHGMDMSGGRGEITVSVKCGEDGALTILVSDNGRTDRIDEINRCINGEQPVRSGGEGLGLGNVYQRIEHVFGSEGSLRYRLNEEGHTEAVITLKIYDSDPMKYNG